jgi:methyl-accepting chemotaxis protein
LFEVFGVVGRDVVAFVISVAGLLVSEEMPGLVALSLFVILLVSLLVFSREISRRRAAANWLRQLISQSATGQAFTENIDSLSARVKSEGKAGDRQRLAVAWNEYRETLVPYEEGGIVTLRNAVRPSTFLNIDDLGFGPGFWRFLPGIFVSTGLFLTFLGLISALHGMSQDLSDQGEMNSGAMANLLSIASAKFIMSLTGLFCSIVFTVIFRSVYSGLERSLHYLCNTIEERLTYISLEALAAEQLRTTREQREHFRLIGMELVAEIGRPLREELPAAIQKSITGAMAPIVEKVGKMGAEGVGDMVSGLSSKLTDSVGLALTDASQRIAEAGDRIGQLIDRMDQSSGRMGSEMEIVTARVAQAVEDLRNSMKVTTEAAGGAFSEGAEKLLSVMNRTLEGIRDNTGEGARAIAAAAAEMKDAAQIFKSEIESATQTGTQAAQAQMEAAGQQVSLSISDAGRNVADVFGRTSAEIASVASDVAAKANQQLLAPLSEIGQKLEGLVRQLNDGSSDLRRMADGVRAGAEASESAAGTFRSAAGELVSAVNPVRSVADRMETSIRQLADSTQHTASTVSRAAETTAQSAADALSSAREILGAEARSIENALAGVATMLDKLRGQGERLDDMDAKLGKAFALYAENVEKAVQGMFGHVRDMQERLSPALDTMREIVEQAEQFSPQSRRV